MFTPLTSIQRFDELFEESTQNMIRAYFGKPEKDVYKKTMFSSSWLDRLLNNLAGLDLKLSLKKRNTSIEDIVTKHREGNSNSSILEELREEYANGKSLLRPISKVIYHLQRKRHPYLTQLEKMLPYCKKVSEYCEDFNSDIEEYKKRYGEELFLPYALARARSNVMAMRLFAACNESKNPPKKAMNAIALLHPITDDYMDRGVVDSRFVKGIDEKLAGKSVETDNPYEKLVYNLIDDMFSDYPKNKHPILHRILECLSAEQVRSMKQKKHDTSIEEIADISLRKGGLSTLAAGYIALGGLTENQFKFFYEVGALFQFIDDFGDTKEDLSDGVATIWTSKISDRNLCDEPLNRTMELQKNIHRSSVDEYIKDFRNPSAVDIFYEVGFRMLMLRGYFANEQHFSPMIAGQISRTLPADYDEVRKIMLCLQGTLSPVISKI